MGIRQVKGRHIGHQPTSSKFQTPNSREAPSSKLEARAAVWSLELGISLVFGAWFLVFQFRDFSGAWCLVLGVSLGGGSKIEMPNTYEGRARGAFPGERRLTRHVATQ